MWQLAVGSPSIASVNVSPVNLNLALLCNVFTIPIIYALNIASALTLASCGIVMLIYTVKPDKPYSNKLLGFGYKKTPLCSDFLHHFNVCVELSGAEIFRFCFPLIGSSFLLLPQNMVTDGVNISVAVSAGFGWPFYFAIVVAGLCVAARLYHEKLKVISALPPPSSQQ